MAQALQIIPDETIARRICRFRGRTVMLDYHLAGLYGVTTKALNQAVSRNLDRFPEDFSFRLEAAELAALNRSQSVTGSQMHRDPKHPPRAFTQEGVAMLSGVLRSPQAIAVNIAIMRTFVRMREAAASHAELARRLDEMAETYDGHFRTVFETLRSLMEAPPAPPHRPIGFIWPAESADETEISHGKNCQ